MVTVTVEALLGAPCPRAGVTITGLGIGDSVVSVWRTADGERESVRGARRKTMTDAGYITDYAVPLGRPVTYEVEVISGPTGAARVYAAPVFVDSPTGFIQDALVPQNSVPVVGGDGDEVYLRPAALKALEYEADISIFDVMGASKPIALFGQRGAEKGLDTSLGAASAEQNARLKRLLTSTAQLLFRPLPSMGDYGMSGSLYLANPKASQLPVNVSWGGQLTWWDLKSDVVAAPTVRVLTATFTWGDVSILFKTWQQKQDAIVAGATAAGEAPTWLFDLKNPLG